MSFACKQVQRTRCDAHLKTTTVGEHIVGPIHELMDATHFCNQIGTGSHRQMISVAQQNLTVNGMHLFGGESFDGGLGADGPVAIHTHAQPQTHRQTRQGTCQHTKTAKTQQTHVAAEKETEADQTQQIVGYGAALTGPRT